MSTSTQRVTSVVVAPSTIRRVTTSSAVAPVPTSSVLTRVLPSPDPATTAQVSRLVPASTTLLPVATTPLPVPGTALSRPTSTISTAGVLPSSAATTAPAAKGISTTTLIAIIVPVVLVVCAILGFCLYRRNKKQKKRYSDLQSTPHLPQNYSTEKLVQSPHSLQSPRSILNPGNDWGSSPTFSATPTYPPLASPALYVSPPPDDRRSNQAQMQWEEERADVKLVKRSFEPTLPDELVIHPGDRVQILTRFSDGWSLGINLDAADQGVVFKGVFPYDCLEDNPTYGNTPAPSSSAVNPPNSQPVNSFPAQQQQSQPYSKSAAPINALYNATPLPAPLGPLPSPTPSFKTTNSGNVGYFPSPSPNGTYHPTAQQHANTRVRGPTPPNVSTPRSNIPKQSPQLDPFPRESSPFMTINEEDESYGSRSANAATGLGISSPPRSNGGGRDGQRQGRPDDSPMRENDNGRAGGNQKRTSSLLRKNGNGGGRSDREKEMLDALSGL